jgi:MFS superfamily sulfate permease-like transporter
LYVVSFLDNIWNKRIIYGEGRGMMSAQFFIGLMAGICISLLFTLYLYRRWNNQKKEFIENQERFVKVVENTKDILYYYQVKPERQFKYLSPSLRVFLVRMQFKETIKTQILYTEVSTQIIMIYYTKRLLGK